MMWGATLPPPIIVEPEEEEEADWPLMMWWWPLLMSAELARDLPLLFTLVMVRSSTL